MPTVKNRARQDIAERAERPVQVRMHQEAGQRIERHQYEECLGTEADQADEQIDQCGIQNEVDGMNAHRGQPVDLLRGMMNAMETPERIAVEQPMAPVLHYVSDE